MASYAGLDGVRSAIVERLSLYLHPYMAAYETELNLPGGTLSVESTGPESLGLMPKLISKVLRPAIGLTDFPALMVVAQSVTRTSFHGLSVTHPALQSDPRVDDAKEIERRYRIRVFGYVKAQGYEDTSLARDRLETVVFRCLADGAQLGDNLTLDMGSYTSSLSDISQAPNTRSQNLAAWYSQFELNCLERVSAPSSGKADTIKSKIARLS